MKALSLWQPWASAIAVGSKSIETRSWSTDYRGPLAIHAGRTTVALLQVVSGIPSVLRAVFQVAPGQDLGHALLGGLPFGAVIATCDLVDCVRVEHLGDRSWRRHERELGDYRSGRYGWVLENVRALPSPIPCRGRQGLFDVKLPQLEGSSK